jgi:DedD protein
MSDEGFHEIQLNGKQLVFLFMAATVVSVVIFLCGVLVGRGVPASGRGAAADLAADASVDPTAPVDAPAITGSSGTAQGRPLSAQETLTYAERLEAPTPPRETLRAPVSPTPAVPPTRRDVAPAAVVEAPAVAAATSALTSEPSGSGYVVQVASVKERREADAMARRLAAKGYPSFVTTVTTPGAAVPTGFRIRIGKYDDRREAETVSRRLQKEEQFKPWITR